MVERTASPRSPLQTQKPTLDATLLIDGRGAPRSGSAGTPVQPATCLRTVRTFPAERTDGETGASAKRSAPATHHAPPPLLANCAKIRKIDLRAENNGVGWRIVPLRVARRGSL